jgi:Flp pilus assembly protein TadB
LGAGVGLGVFLLFQVLYPAPAPIARTLAEIDAAAGRIDGRPATGVPTTTDLLHRVAADLRRRGLRPWVPAADLAILDRSIDDVLAWKTLGALAGLGCLPIVAMTSAAVSGTASFGASTSVALLFAGAGFCLPDLMLTRRAAHRRRDLRFAVSAFLDVVSLNLAAGRGVNEALGAAGTISTGWAFTLLVHAQVEARLTGATPWEAFHALGQRVDVAELRDLAGSLHLAADEGATLRTTLAARAGSLRRGQLSDAEGRAGEDAQSMVLAMLLLAGAFVLFVMYPPLIHLFTP